MKNINNIVKYMRRRSEELKGVSMMIPVSKPLWDHIADVLESYCLELEEMRNEKNDFNPGDPRDRDGDRII